MSARTHTHTTVASEQTWQTSSCAFHTFLQITQGHVYPSLSPPNYRVEKKEQEGEREREGWAGKGGKMGSGVQEQLVSK